MSEGFDAGRTLGTDQAKPAGHGAKAPGPSGSRLLAARFVAALVRCEGIDRRTAPAGSTHQT